MRKNDFEKFDQGTPTESDVDDIYGSKFLTTADAGNRNLRKTVTNVSRQELRGNDGVKEVKLALHFEGTGKLMLLNVTNVDTLVESLGKNPANWIGAHVEIYVDPSVTHSGRRVGGLRLRVPGPGPATKRVGSVPPPGPPLSGGTGVEDIGETF